jgi:spore germination protein PC
MHEFYQWLYNLWQQTVWQNAKLAELESLVRGLKEQLDRMEAGCPHIGRIEYHFDQLKVEKLEGALHIGISPGSKGLLDEMSVNGKDAFDVVLSPEGKPEDPDSAAPGRNGSRMAGAEPPVYSGTAAEGQPAGAQEPYESIRRYLEYELPGEIESYEDLYGLPLGADYRSMIVGDLRRQVEARISHYLREEAQHGRGDGPESGGSAVVEKVKRDLAAAVRLHMEGLKNRNGGNAT